jgi:hypothetical protein
MEYTTLEVRQHQMFLSGHEPLTSEQEEILVTLNNFDNFVSDVESVLPF